ncbi:hypothetical protein ACP4OV_015428 [Aristida adscensionis]
MAAVAVHVVLLPRAPWPVRCGTRVDDARPPRRGRRFKSRAAERAFRLAKAACGMTLQLIAMLPLAGSSSAPAGLRLQRSGKVGQLVRMSSSSLPPSPAPVDPSLDTVAPRAAVTRERGLNPDLQEQVPKPYLARAVAAVDSGHPQGTGGRNPRGMSVLQQHVAFFDRNGDGVIYPWETLQGLRAIGCGLPVSFVGSILINPTQPGWLPSPLLSIYIKNIHKGKHGSDSETYDTEGRFDPSKFDAIFSKYSRTQPNALTKEELMSMLKGNRNMYDFIGLLLLVSGCYSIVSRRIKMVCYNGKLSGVPLMAVFLSDYKKIRNRPDCTGVAPFKKG